MTSSHCRSACVALLVLWSAACASAPPTAPPPATPTPVPGVPTPPRERGLPAIPAADGPLRLEVGYPPEGSTIAVRDSNFIFGSTGSGQTQLTINGQSVQVAPNGGFLAYIPVPADGVYRLNATKGTETATLERRITVPAAPAAAAATAAARITSAYRRVRGPSRRAKQSRSGSERRRVRAQRSSCPTDDAFRSRNRVLLPKRRRVMSSAPT